jgi:hypothetical protein
MGFKEELWEGLRGLLPDCLEVVDLYSPEVHLGQLWVVE